MVMIVRDSAAKLPQTLHSVWDDVDELVIVDTGSADDSIGVARAFAGDERDKLVVGRYAWRDDFAAARNYADSLATGDWIAWCDDDDLVEGLPALREMAENAHPQVGALYAVYEYARLDGRCICEVYRERLVRKGRGRWVGRVHESQRIDGVGLKVSRDVARWVHRKSPFEMSDRNTKILEKWVEAEPTNPRALAYLARDHLGNQRATESLSFYERYLSIPGQSRDKRAQVARQFCSALLSIGRVESAYEQALRSFKEHPTWPDTHLTLAEIAAMRHDWQRVHYHARLVLKMGPPDTPLIATNPTDYTIRPRMMMAQAEALGITSDYIDLPAERD
jgi:glycosyltransferase involved in cell wall biosynthesis